jgi:hypothetical protein
MAYAGIALGRAGLSAVPIRMGGPPMGGADGRALGPATTYPTGRAGTLLDAPSASISIRAEPQGLTPFATMRRGGRCAVHYSAAKCRSTKKPLAKTGRSFRAVQMRTRVNPDINQGLPYNGRFPLKDAPCSSLPSASSVPSPFRSTASPPSKSSISRARRDPSEAVAPLASGQIDDVYLIGVVAYRVPSPRTRAELSVWDASGGIVLRQSSRINA